jgi:hypothetical protein
MAGNVFNIGPQHNGGRISLHGSMSVALDTAVNKNFVIRFFTTTDETFMLQSNVFQFKDLNGSLVTGLLFGGAAAMSIELMFDPVNGVWLITDHNMGGAASVDAAEKTISLAALPAKTVVNRLLGKSFRISMDKNAKLGNPSGMKAGDEIRFVLVQDAVGGRTLDYDLAYGFVDILPPKLSLAPNATDLIEGYKTAGGMVMCKIFKNIGVVTPIAYTTDFAYTMGVAVTAAQANPVNGQTIQVLRDGNRLECNTTIGFNLPQPLDIRVRGAAMIGDRWPRLRLERGDRAGFGKAIINIEGGRNVVIEDLEISGGTSVEDGNGCGVLINPNADYVLLKNLHIIDSENGVRSGVSTRPVIDMLDCLLERNGYSMIGNEVGQTHSIYIGDGTVFRAERVSFMDSMDGHNIKSRSARMQLKQVYATRSHASRELDYPDHGILHAYDSVFFKDSDAGQNSLVGIGYEVKAGVNRPQEYFFYNCYFHNDIVDVTRAVTFLDNMKNGATVNDVAVHYIDCEFGGALLNKVGGASIFNGPYTITLTGGPTGPRVPAGDPRALFNMASRDPNRKTNPLNIALTPLEALPAMASMPQRPAYPAVFAPVPPVPPLPNINDGELPPAPDTTAPSVVLAASSNNVTASGNLTLTATASDNVGVTKVEFYRGNVLLATKTAAPYTHVVALTAADNGTQTYTAKAFDAVPNTKTSTSIDVVVDIPVPHTRPTTTLDATTQTAYNTAANGAAVGGKRMAAANAVVNAMQPSHRLYIYKDGEVIVSVTYTGAMLAVDDGYDVSIQPSNTVATSEALKSGDLATGTWWFEIQGGTSYARFITGSVGAAGSGADLELDDNPAVGQGFDLRVNFVIPRSLDNLV